MQFTWTTNLDSTTYKDALNIRKEVFVDEQHVPIELEIDDLESETIHVTGYEKEHPVATARIYEKYPRTYKVQRVAVVKSSRKKGTGKKLMHEIYRYAKEQGAEKLILDAQDHALPFYESLGYTVEGEGFLDAGIPHHFMFQNISSSSSAL